MGNSERVLFIKGMKYLFNISKRKAEQIYAKADTSYINVVIKAFEQNSYISFWDD